MYNEALDNLRDIYDYTAWLKQNNLCNTLQKTPSQKVVKKLFFETIS